MLVEATALWGFLSSPRMNRKIFDLKTQRNACSEGEEPGASCCTELT